MTFSPPDLLACRSLIMAKTGLSAVSVGIVGGNGGGGYHFGADGVVQGDYSVVESPRDWNHLSGAASGVDIGEFAYPGVSLRSFSADLVAACERGDPRAEAIREVIWSPDGVTVLRWDALGVRSTGDATHRTHTHLGLFRDSEGRRDRADNLHGLLVEILGGSPTPPSNGPTTEDVMLLIQFEGSPDVFLTDGATARHIASESEMYDIKALGNEGSISLGNGGNLRIVGRRSLIGAIVGPVPLGWEDRAAHQPLTAQQVTVLAAQIATALGSVTGPSHDEIVAAVQDAIRGLVNP